MDLATTFVRVATADSIWSRVKYPIALSVALFFGTAALGFLLSFGSISADLTLVDLLVAPHKSSFGIFTNNLYASGIMVVGGGTFGFLTAFSLVSNGLIIGSGAAVAVADHGVVGLGAVILPHGFFELPAILFVGAAGFRVAQGMTLFVTDRASRSAYNKLLVDVGLLVTTSVVLLVVAALIEVHVTPQIVDVVT